MSFSDDLKKFTQKVQSRVEQVSQDIPPAELFTPAFVSEHTPHNTFEELLFAAIPEDVLNGYLAANTKFPNLLEMRKAAGVFAIEARARSINGDA